MRMFCSMLRHCLRVWSRQREDAQLHQLDREASPLVHPSFPSSFNSRKSPRAVQARAASLVIASSSFVAIGGSSEEAKPQV